MHFELILVSLMLIDGNLRCFLFCFFKCSKDTNGFFAFPVTDNIAPGYSSVISTPMDFSAMQSKIENAEYQNVLEYKVTSMS